MATKGTGRGRVAGEPLRHRPGPDLDRRRGSAGIKSRNTPFDGVAAQRQGPPHRVPGRAGRHRRKGAAMTPFATPTVRAPVASRARRWRGVRGRDGRFRPARRRGDGRARLQHVDVRIPRGADGPELLGTGRLLHLSAHRQLRRRLRTTTRPIRSGHAGFVVRDLPPRPSNWRSSGALESMLESRGVAGDHRHRHQACGARGACQRGVACAFGTAGLSMLAQAAADEPGTTDVDLVTGPGGVTTAEPYIVGSGAFRVVSVRLRDEVDDA